MYCQNLRTLYEGDGPRATCLKLGEALALGRRGDPDGLRPEDFSLKELAEAFCGEEWYKKLDPRYHSRFGNGYEIFEGEAVDVSAFSNITGQIVYSKILDGWNSVPTIADMLMETVPSNLSGEKMPWVGNVIGVGENIHPGKEYPEAGFGEQYIETPLTTKKGMIVSVMKETIFFDRTAQVTKRAAQAGERLKQNLENLKLDTICGAVNSFKWNGTSYNTYIASGTYWDNLVASTPLVDHTSVNAALVKFANLIDPENSEPIDVEPDTLLVPPALAMTADRIVSATTVSTVYPGYAVSSPSAPGNVIPASGNPLARYGLKVMSSPRLFRRIINNGGGSAVSASDAAGYWFVGNFKKAFGYAENWPVTVVQAPANAEAEFTKDIVLRYKASERGIPFVQDPRYVMKLTAAA